VAVFLLNQFVPSPCLPVGRGRARVGVTLRHAQGDHGELVEPTPSPPSPPTKGEEIYGEGGDATSLDGGRE